MERYELRIIEAGDPSPRIFAILQTSDFAAIRRAQALAKPGQSVEVWRDMTCIFAQRNSGEKSVLSA